MNDEQYEYLLTHIEHHGIENAFYYIMYCVDWQYMYEYDGRLTMFDIIVSCEQEKFQKAYSLFKSFVVDGDISNLKDSYDKVKSCIKKGLRNKGILDTGDKDRKGLGEFIYNFYLKVANVDYEFDDYSKSYLSSGIGISNKIIVDYFYKFIYAYQLMNDFKVLLVPKDVGQYQIEYDPYFILHVLLRHYPQTKIYYKNHSNPLYKKKIKNGLGNDVNITAIQFNRGIKVISSDGIFKSSYEERLLKVEKLDILRDDVSQILSTLDSLLQILVNHENPLYSPAIVYYQNVLYGIEFKMDDIHSNIIRICSFYPLNSEWQKTFGISIRDYHSIVNKKDMFKENYSVHIENPCIIKCTLLYNLYEHYISRVICKLKKL
ncbi:MAG: hypothetical protein IKV26_06625 [Paludibacteraceae bacterium]|nr:hypothetical protein [Paludibacteraceae bacterium]